MYFSWFPVVTLLPIFLAPEVGLVHDVDMHMFLDEVNKNLLRPIHLVNCYEWQKELNACLDMRGYNLVPEEYLYCAHRWNKYDTRQGANMTKYMLTTHQMLDLFTRTRTAYEAFDMATKHGDWTVHRIVQETAVLHEKSSEDYFTYLQGRLCDARTEFLFQFNPKVNPWDSGDVDFGYSTRQSKAALRNGLWVCEFMGNVILPAQEFWKPFFPSYFGSKYPEGIIPVCDKWIPVVHSHRMMGNGDVAERQTHYAYYHYMKRALHKHGYVFDD
jgi:hypothetical protein